MMSRTGTTFLENAVRDTFYALRTFARAPLASLTIVGTVALGLGLIAAAFTLVNALLFRADAVPDVHQMYAVERSVTAGDAPEGFTRAQFDALVRETDIFTGAYAERSQVDGRAEGRLIFGTFVTGSFFDVLGVHASMGRTLTSADEESSVGQPVMVLSHRGWERLFARDPAIVGRRLRVNDVTFEIVGVMPEGFRGLTIVPDDYWAPLPTLALVRPSDADRAASGASSSRGDGEAGLAIVGRLKPDLSPQVAAAQLAAWDARQSPGRSIGRNGSDVTLVPRRGTVPQPLEIVPLTAPLFFAFGLILMIGCANVANLLLARGVARQREIGIRLSLGASRGRIIRQLLTESLLLALAAAAAGFVISRVALEAIIAAITNSMPPDIGDVRLLVPDADWRVLLFLAAGAVVSTIAFGLAPALQATRIHPMQTIRGEAFGDARPGRMRNLLIGLQVSASALLLISAAVFLKSALAASRFDPGMRTSDILYIQIPNESAREAIVQAVTAQPLVTSVAAQQSVPAPRAAFAESSGATARVALKFASPESFSVLDVAVVRGRAFTSAERTPELPVAIVSETAARALWPNGDALGQVVRIDAVPASGPGAVDGPPFESRTLTVVGVARDVAGFRIAPFEKAVVYVPTSADMPGTSLVARVQGDVELARQALLDRLTLMDPDMARQVVTMRTVATMEAYFLRMAFWLAVVLGGLALALTLSGLFSVLSYLVEQRTREIGVRMALGATTRDITRLVLAQSMRPVGSGLLIGGGLAASAAALLLSTSAAAGAGEIVRVLDPSAYAAAVLVVVAGCLAAASIPAARAARLDPAQTLRQE